MTWPPASPAVPSLTALSAALEQPIGRGTLISRSTAAQLLDGGGQGVRRTLAEHLWEVAADTVAELHVLLGGEPVPRPARLPEWALLTESEHPTWPLLALSQPPALASAASARVAYAQWTHPQPLSWARCRTLAQGGHGQQPLPLLEALGWLSLKLTWGQLLAVHLTVQAHQLTLPLWGVLSAHIGLQTDYRRQAAADLWEVMRSGLPPAPSALAQAAGWAVLRPLHGGLPLQRAQVESLIADLRTFSARPAPVSLPSMPELAHLLSRRFGERGPELAAQFMAQVQDPHEDIFGQTPQTGLVLLAQPGQIAYWLRRGGQVQLMTATMNAPEETISLQSWVWDLRPTGTRP